MTDSDYVDNLALPANTSVQAESLRYSLEQATGGIGLHVDTSPIDWGCRIHQLHLCRRVRPHIPNECPGGEAPVLEIWGM